MPLPIATFAHSCATSVPANAVDLREPLKPALPAELHASTFPRVSVMQHCVLLKPAVMCAMPAGIERPRRLALASSSGVAWASSTSPITMRIASEMAGFFGASSAAGAGTASGIAAGAVFVSSDMVFLRYFAACFIALRSALSRTAPTVCLAPLRVRAFVRVRWPRTGRPLRWRVPR